MAKRRTGKKAATGKATAAERILAIDIGGSGLKAALLDARGKMVSERVRVPTRVGSKPDAVVATLADLVRPLGSYQRVSVGFPGPVRRGVTLGAANLGHDGWKGFDLARALTRRLRRPVRVVNDADMQGLGAARGRGVEMVITLGTGFGTALLEDGRLAPHLEIAHQPFRSGQTYDQQLGDRARRKLGNRHWSRRVVRAVANLRRLVNFDRLYVGGGNAARLDLSLGDDVTVVANETGLKGGAALWRER